MLLVCPHHGGRRRAVLMGVGPDIVEHLPGHVVDGRQAPQHLRAAHRGALSADLFKGFEYGNNEPVLHMSLFLNGG